MTRTASHGRFCKKVRPCLPVLQERFGSDILDEKGELRRRLLADRAFATPEGTRFLTETTQPEILRQIESRLERAAASGAPFTFVDGAVIVGTPFEARCDHLLLVTAPYESSVQRICARDGITPEMARRRLDAQTALETLRGCRNRRDRERWFAFSVGKPDQGVFALLEKGGL